MNQEALKILELYKRGQRRVEYAMLDPNSNRLPMWRRVYSEGMQMINSATAQAKQFSSRMGRIRKRQAFLERKYKIITLTEIFGIPWRVLVKRQKLPY